MPIFGHSEFLKIKMEHQILAVPNFFSIFPQNGSKKLRMPSFGLSKFLPVFLHQNGAKKIGTLNFGCSKFLAVFLHQNGSKKFRMPNFARKNLEWPILGILNLFKPLK